jgi:hypothetical protein
MQVRGVAAAMLLFGVISGLGQDPQNAPRPNSTPQTATPENAPSQNVAEMSSHDAPATFSSKVNLVMVPVVVRDSKGKAIGTLQKEDFQLFDKGKPQVISRFSVEKAGESAIPVEVATDDATDKPATPAIPAGPSPSDSSSTCLTTFIPPRRI